jgi:hypothetical protein
MFSSYRRRGQSLDCGASARAGKLPAVRFGVVTAVMLVITGCTKLRPGSDFNPVLLDTGTNAQDAGARDLGAEDRSLREEAGPTDTDTPDAEPGDDGTFDAGDLGIECVPEKGQPCFAEGICGATYDCFGSCTGGTQAPPCACAQLTCDPNNQWSACPDPPDYGTSCDTPTSCGGQIDCAGACAGGTALPMCQCGTPTCAGCVGGTCDFNSTCTNGQCTCTVNDCTMNGTYCWAGALQTCTVDSYLCGAYSNPMMCMFGCTDFAPECACSPETGFYCAYSTCFCSCGDFERPGTVQCDGTCDPDSGCAIICRSECGPV